MVRKIYSVAGWLALIICSMRFFLVGDWFYLFGIITAILILTSSARMNALLHWLQDKKDSSPRPQDNLLEDIYFIIQQNKKQQQQQLEITRQHMLRMETFAHNMPDGIILLDKKNRILWCNEIVSKLLNIMETVDHGRPLTDLIRNRHLSILLGTDGGNSMEIQSPNEKNIWIELRYANYPNCKLLLVRDITEKHELEETRRNFLSQVSHELRTPLAVIIGYAEMLHSTEKKSAEQSESIELIQQHAQHMQKTLDDILLLSKYENAVVYDAVSLPAGPVNVIALIEQILEEIQLIDKQQHEFSLHLDRTLALNAKKADLYSIFSNLLSNAVSYCNPRGNIQVYWQRDKTGACFCVADDGPGIAGEHLSRLTERFYRVYRDRPKDTGCGLGLAIVEQVMRGYRGKLLIDSVMDQGSRFACIFPREHCIDVSIADE